MNVPCPASKRVCLSPQATQTLISLQPNKEQLSYCAACLAGHAVPDVMQVGPVRIGDIPSAAVDFHVSDIVEEVAAYSTHHPETGPPTTPAQLKQAMWQRSSGVTSKKPFGWRSGWACISHLQLVSDDDAEARHIQRTHAASQPGPSPADLAIARVWEKEAMSVSAWARRYLEKRFF